LAGRTRKDIEEKSAKPVAFRWEFQGVDRDGAEEVEAVVAYDRKELPTRLL
jgi:hypothetical protein